MSNNLPVPGVPGLYQRPGKRRVLYFCKPQNKYTPLGYDLEVAKAELAKLMETPPAPGQHTVAYMCHEFIKEQRAYIAAHDPEARAVSTIDDYEASLTRFIIPVFGHMHPDSVTKNHIAKYLKDGRATRRVRANRDRAALSGAYKFGLGEGLAQANPCIGVPRNMERARTRKVSIAEFNDFLEHARSKGGSAYLVALIGCTVALTGRRRAEILHLTKSALQPEGFKVKDSKTKFNEPERHYLIAWSDLLHQVIAEVAAIKRRVSSIYLFATLDGTPYVDAGFKCLWNRLMHSYAPGGTKDAKWFTAHDLRALYVSEMKHQERDPNTHRQEKTMNRVYDRRELIKVTPLA
ncbi:tyrosine-type recombinase/integrase [Rhodoferax fermentans]|uniref:tyrosine-type recombinase/integrase n=1 Tax=Rhodoferax fermentans TaxID=28066 RepID=UPI00117A11B6|nr:hypothetical protein [Rhodoferax fermentans]